MCLRERVRVQIGRMSACAHVCLRAFMRVCVCVGSHNCVCVRTCWCLFIYAVHLRAAQVDESLIHYPEKGKKIDYKLRAMFLKRFFRETSSQKNPEKAKKTGLQIASERIRESAHERVSCVYIHTCIDVYIYTYMCTYIYTYR